jgi:hypothetical protein
LIKQNNFSLGKYLIISNFFGKIILHRLTNFLNKFNILSDVQHDCRENRSTTTAAYDFYDFVEKIYPVFEKRSTALGLFIDLSKAFDLVDHSILLTKLYNIGIQGNALALFESYLGNRKQHVSITILQAVLSLV